MTPTQEQGIAEMVSDMRAGDQLYWPSPFWEQLIESQTKQLEDAGFEHFKRTLNLQYFSWNMKWVLVLLIWPMLWNWIRHPDVRLLAGRANLHKQPAEGFTGVVRRIENRLLGVYILLLWHFVKRYDRLAILDQLDEPVVGDPIVVSHRGHRISQDLPNSVHEFYSATAGLDLDAPLEVVELGGGYGRVGYVFLNMLDKCSYTLVDIPPTLHIAQRYMAEVYPTEKIFAFRPFSSYDEVRDEFESARIRFIAAHQIEMLPDSTLR